jgi:hypothetical protein
MCAIALYALTAAVAAEFTSHYAWVYWGLCGPALAGLTLLRNAVWGADETPEIWEKLR